MKYFYKTGIICLILILCTVIATGVTAEENSFLSLGAAESANVMNSASEDLNNIMNSLWGEEVSVLSETQTALWRGQSSQVYRVSLSCPGMIRMTSSYGASFNLYAKKNTGSNSCPTAFSLRNNYDKVVTGNGGTSYMNLEPGVWCFVIYGYSGSGSYSLQITQSCSNPRPWPTPYPTITPTPCTAYKTDSRQGFLNQGQAAVYGYLIPSGSRSKIEWTMTSSSSSQDNDIPIIMASAGNPSVYSSYSDGRSTFDLYIFKDCNPKNSRCNTRYYSYGPNSHVSVLNPSTGSIYYVMIHARAGSGTYNLKMNSYMCTSGDDPIIMASSDENIQKFEVSQDSGVGSEVSSPTADFIIVEGAN